jgi:hypothetical protein
MLSTMACRHEGSAQGPAGSLSRSTSRTAAGSRTPSPAMNLRCGGSTRHWRHCQPLPGTRLATSRTPAPKSWSLSFPTSTPESINFLWPACSATPSKETAATVYDYFLRPTTFASILPDFPMVQMKCGGGSVVIQWCAGGSRRTSATHSSATRGRLPTRCAGHAIPQSHSPGRATSSTTRTSPLRWPSLPRIEWDIKAAWSWRAMDRRGRLPT